VAWERAALWPLGRLTQADTAACHAEVPGRLHACCCASAWLLRWGTAWKCVPRDLFSSRSCCRLGGRRLLLPWEVGGEGSLRYVAWEEHLECLPLAGECFWKALLLYRWVLMGGGGGEEEVAC